MCEISECTATPWSCSNCVTRESRTLAYGSVSDSNVNSDGCHAVISAGMTVSGLPWSKMSRLL